MLVTEDFGGGEKDKWVHGHLQVGMSNCKHPDLQHEDSRVRG